MFLFYPSFLIKRSVNRSLKAYAASKRLLASGSLDDALSALEAALRLSRETLDAADAADDNDNAADGMELQESLAPLYYLYGTTL